MHALALALSTLAAQPDATPGPTGPQPPATVTSEPGPTAEPPPQAPPATATAEPQPIAEPPPAPPAQTPAQAPAAATTAEPRPRWWGPFPRPKVSGYGGPALRLSGLHGAFAAFVGLEGGVNVLQRVTIGASLLWLLNPVPAGDFSRAAANRLNLNYGGLVVDVAYVRGARVSGTVGGLLGGGGACVQNPENGACADKTSFFVGEPRAGLRVVLAPIVRLHLAFGWRLIAARGWSGPPDPRLGGPSGTVTLEFGWF